MKTILNKIKDLLQVKNLSEIRYTPELSFDEVSYSFWDIFGLIAEDSFFDSWSTTEKLTATYQVLVLCDWQHPETIIYENIRNEYELFDGKSWRDYTSEFVKEII